MATGEAPHTQGKEERALKVQGNPAQRNGLTIYFAKMTSWSLKSYSFLEEVAAEVVLAVEVHLRGVKMSACRRRLAREGWCSTASGARAGKGTGNSGGVLVLVQKQLASCKVKGQS